jgi:outer membrane protein assembly factor BamB
MPKEDVSLVCLDMVTGERRWTVPGRGRSGGAPLILNDPDNPGKQIIYHSTYETAMALRPDGSVVWKKPTGLKTPIVEPGEDNGTKLWGMNYHPQTDSLINVSISGIMFALDRKTGERLTTEPFQIPGAPAAGEVPLPKIIHKLGNKALEEVFGELISGDVGWFSRVLYVVFGKGVLVANFYAVDPNTGRIYVAATEPDDLDGEEDGISKNGALYLLDLVKDDKGSLEFKTIKYYSFVGGTGSTPAVSPASDRIMVSDDNGYVIALTADLKESWRVDVGSQVAASVAISPDNNEIYAITKYDIIKIIDYGDRGEIAWRADLDDFPGQKNFNTLTPTIAANGIAVGVGGGIEIGEQMILHLGMGLLDRETGKLKSFAVGREDSIAVTAIGPDGGYYIGSSPIRRAVISGAFGPMVPPIVGGVQRYKPIRLDLLVRDASCASAARADNASGIAADHPKSAQEDIRQIRVLIKQSREALDTAVKDGDLTPDQQKSILVLLDEAESNLSLNGLPKAAEALDGVCSMFD